MGLDISRWDEVKSTIHVSLNDLKAAPSAITPDCLIDTFVDDAAKSVEPDPPQRPHIRLQQRQRRMRKRAVRRPPRQAPSTTIEMKYFLSSSLSQASSGVVVVVVTPETVTTKGMVDTRASGLCSVA